MRRFFQTTSTKSLFVTCFLSFFFSKVQVKPPPSSLPLARHTFFTVSFEGKYGPANECERCDNHHVTRDWDKEEIVSPPHDSNWYSWTLDSMPQNPGILDSWFCCQWNLDSEFQLLLRFQIPLAVFRIPKPRIPDFKSKIFLESGIPYLGRSIQAAVNVDGCLYTRNILMYYLKLWWNLFYSWIFFFQRVWTYQALTPYRM